MTSKLELSTTLVRISPVSVLTLSRRSRKKNVSDAVPPMWTLKQQTGKNYESMDDI
jgi:hypothetical protein